VILFSVEGVKLVSSACVVYFAKSNNEDKGGTKAFSFASFPLYCVPALCYFISNNCMFYIIRELGPTTFQITNNLKTLSTSLLMRFVLSHRLTWTQVKVLVILACGSIVTWNLDGIFICVIIQTRGPTRPFLCDALSFALSAMMIVAFSRAWARTASWAGVRSCDHGTFN